MTDLIDAISKCDKCATYAELCDAAEKEVYPILEKLFLIPLKVIVADDMTVDESCPDICAARDAVEQEGYDDVWFFLYRMGASILQKASSRKRNRDSSLVDYRVITNAFTFFCNRSVPPLEKIRMRWSFLKKEKNRFEVSDSFVHANSSERRKLQKNSVLSIFSERAHKHFYTAFWLKCIEKAEETALHTHLLYKLGQIIPCLTNPLIVADYLTECFRSGGLISVLSLQGIFVLMIDHGLEYPQYYEQLYSLITTDTFSSRHRYDLFRLLDLSMSSRRVPSYIAASIIKRTARVALLSPSPTLFFSLPFIRKVLQVHSNCLALIHRSSRESTVNGNDNENAGSAKHIALEKTARLFDGADPFLSDAPSCSSNALSSTLWEFTSLEKHYLPLVPLMISSFCSPAEDKSQLKYEKSYGRLFTSEITRPITKNGIPPMAYEVPLNRISDRIIL